MINHKLKTNLNLKKFLLFALIWHSGLNFVSCSKEKEASSNNEVISVQEQLIQEPITLQKNKFLGLTYIKQADQLLEEYLSNKDSILMFSKTERRLSYLLIQMLSEKLDEKIDMKPFDAEANHELEKIESFSESYKKNQILMAEPLKTFCNISVINKMNYLRAHINATIPNGVSDFQQFTQAINALRGATPFWLAILQAKANEEADKAPFVAYYNESLAICLGPILGEQKVINMTQEYKSAYFSLNGYQKMQTVVEWRNALLGVALETFSAEEKNKVWLEYEKARDDTFLSPSAILINKKYHIILLHATIVAFANKYNDTYSGSL